MPNINYQLKTDYISKHHIAITLKLNNITVLEYGHPSTADLTKFCSKKYRILLRLHSNKITFCNRYSRDLIYSYLNSHSANLQSKKNGHSAIVIAITVLDYYFDHLFIVPLLLGFLLWWYLFFARSCNICFCIYIFF